MLWCLLFLLLASPASALVVDIYDVTTPAPTIVNGLVDVVVVVDAHTQPVDTVEAHIDFDPTLVEVVSITQGTDFPVVVQDTFDNTTGHIDYAATALSSFKLHIIQLATIRFRGLAAGTTALAFQHTIPRKTAAFRSGIDVTNLMVDGEVIVAPLPTPTATATTTPSPTQTSTPLPCCGDCNGDGYVSDSEMATCLDISIQATPLAACPQCDCNNDGTVDFDTDLYLVRSNWTNGQCFGNPTRSPTATGIPTSTRTPFQTFTPSITAPPTSTPTPRNCCVINSNGGGCNSRCNECVCGLGGQYSACCGPDGHWDDLCVEAAAAQCNNACFCAPTATPSPLPTQTPSHTPEIPGCCDCGPQSGPECVFAVYNAKRTPICQ